MRLYIKNMACVRCSLVVKSELERLGFRYISVTPGEVEINETIPEERQYMLKDAIRTLGLELIEDKESIIIEQIKTAIIGMISDSEAFLKINFSEYISSKLGYSYHYLSTVFSTAYGSSIERFYISRRIERVKELLVHGKLSFSEIAYKVHYSSVAHLSSQFKKETGLTLSQFRAIEHANKGEKQNQ